MGNTTGGPRRVVERKRRLHKPFRKGARYPGNLVVYGSPPRSVRPGGTHSARELPAPTSSGQAPPDARTVEPKATGRGRLAAVADPARRMAPALAILGSMCTGAVVGSLWTRSAGERPTIDDAPAPFPSAPPPVMAVVAPADAPIEQDRDGILDRHLEEIDGLRSRNRDLEEEVESLTRETLELNEELLSLELEIVSSSTPQPPPTEVRLVYNFVNVPIDGSTDARSASPDERDAPEPVWDPAYEPEYEPEYEVDGDVVPEPLFDAYGNLVEATDPDIDGADGADEATDPDGSGLEAPRPGARSMLR